jgi:diguanylate cyclase (GGDEF)-like protein
MLYRMTADARVFRRVFVVTAISAAISYAVTVLAVRLVYGVNPGLVITASELERFASTLSIFVPLVVCPLVSYRSARLVRDLRAARRSLEVLAQTDQLTGLLNRRGFDAAAHTSLGACRIAGRPVAVLMCDIDHFKALNDSFGHGFGDKSLISLADVLRDLARAEGFIVGRQGGDEFVMMLPGVAQAEAAEIAERLRSACAGRTCDENAVALSVSVGIAASAHSQASLSALLRRADVALYDVKRTGRDRVVAVDVDEQWSSAA